MQNSIPADRLLSIGKSSEYLGVSIDTLRRWEKRGRITPLRSPGGHRYYSKDELDALFGKRYTRDEETQRRTNEELGIVDTAFENSSPVNEPAPEVIQEIATPDVVQNMSNLFHPIIEELPPTHPIADPVSQIPPWRPIEITPQEVPSIPNEQLPPQPVAETSIHKEPESVQRIAESPPLPPEPTYQSILTPEKKDENSLSEEEIERRIHSIIKTEKGGSRSGVVLIIFSSLFAIADIILMIIWITSSRIISPIP
jgi:excisionase family DNA binding protein